MTNVPKEAGHAAGGHPFWKTRVLGFPKEPQPHPAFRASAETGEARGRADESHSFQCDRISGNVQGSVTRWPTGNSMSENEGP